MDCENSMEGREGPEMRGKAMFACHDNGVGNKNGMQYCILLDAVTLQTGGSVWGWSEIPFQNSHLCFLFHISL